MHKLFEHQLEAVEIAKQSSNQRICLYYRTGSGKTLTSLLCMQAWNQDDVLVLAPPSTHNHWKKTAETLGITVDTISHAKFRMSHYKLSKTKALIVDEMHLLGGYKAAGWMKLNLLSRHTTNSLLIWAVIFLSPLEHLVSTTLSSCFISATVLFPSNKLSSKAYSGIALLPKIS